MTAWLASRLAAMIPGWPRCKLVVALSGGVDSVALLHALVRLRGSEAARRRLRLRAIHIDHHLQARSHDWAVHCARLARSWRVPLTILDAQITLPRGASVEAAARDARYALLRADLQPGEYLLTAQHQDDQLETVLLQLLRGSGAAGLSGMFEAGVLGRGRLLRPLLSLTRAALLSYARAEKLVWVDDPSNADLRFDRNYLRAQVLPALRARWPSAAATVSRSARHLSELSELLAQHALADLASVKQGEALVLAPLASLSASRQRAAVRLWLKQRGCTTPDEVHLRRLLEELPGARASANPVVRWPGGEVRRYRGVLLVVPHLPAPGVALAWNWRRRPRLELGPGLGYLQMRVSSRGHWARSELPAALEVDYRVGGERILLRGRHRKLKEMLRAGGVLPWMRTHIPVLRAEKVVWCVPGVWSRESVVRPNRGARVSLEWRDAPAWRLQPVAGGDSSLDEA